MGETEWVALACFFFSFYRNGALLINDNHTSIQMVLASRKIKNKTRVNVNIRLR
jgi:hypothetical protein